MAIELELAKYLEEEEVDMLINQFPVTAEYDGIGLSFFEGIYKGKTCAFICVLRSGLNHCDCCLYSLQSGDCR